MTGTETECVPYPHGPRTHASHGLHWAVAMYPLHGGAPVQVQVQHHVQHSTQHPGPCPPVQAHARLQRLYQYKGRGQG